jgi:predicted nucleic acid-binding protein
MIFVDSNIPMYLVGAAHPNKQRAQDLVERAIESKERLVTDAEVLQEILHRYGALQRLDAVQPAFAALLGVVDAVLPIELEDVELAKEVLLGAAGKLSARDSVHVAVMMRHGVERILSFDRGFDAAPGIERLGA